MIFERHVKDTLTPFGLSPGDTLRFTLQHGSAWEMSLVKASAQVVARGFDAYCDPGHARGDIRAYTFEAVVNINGREHVLRREVGSTASFYEPWTIDGSRLWFDACGCAFKKQGGFMEEKDWRASLICEPHRLTRWAIQEAGLPICPETLHEWYPNPSGRIEIGDCYMGEDCWMGPYNGGAAHCGLDINMPAGTLLTAPISFDEHDLFNSLAAGFRNNRWIGLRRWPDGSQWQLQAHHLIDMTVPEHGSLAAGTPYATTAGTAVGRREHTHFVWRIVEQGGTYLLDPWIIFHEIWRHRRCGGV
jgi:hypothetical protein